MARTGPGGMAVIPEENVMADEPKPRGNSRRSPDAVRPGSETVG